MKPMDFIKLHGLYNCLKECGNNIRVFKAMLKRECPEMTNGQWNYIQSKCKKMLSENIEPKKKKFLSELKQALSWEDENDN